MVWSCTVAPLWQRKARRRKSILTLSLLSQSTPPCTSATTSFTPRWDLLLVFCVCIYFSCREDSWNMNFSVYISLTFCDILIIHPFWPHPQHRHWQPCSLMTVSLALLWSTVVGHCLAHYRATPGRCYTSSLWTYPRSTVLTHNAYTSMNFCYFQLHIRDLERID